MALLKDIYSESFLTSLANKINQTDPTFSTALFLEKVLSADWEELALLARVNHIVSCLHDMWSQKSLSQLKMQLLAIHQGESGLAYLFLPAYVAKYGQTDLTLSLELLAILTSSSSAEFAIREFLLTNYQETITTMKKWALSEEEHLRRLASEGCRTRLPWAKRVPALMTNTADIVTILTSLKNDSALYVRKSVANSLNDLSKDHPTLVLDLVKKWQTNPTPECSWIIRHGLRTLIKEGHPVALALLDYGDPTEIILTQATLTANSPAILLGEKSLFTYNLTGTVTKDTTIRLLLEINFVKKNGQSAKRFFITEKLLTTGNNTIGGTKHYLWKDLTTRTHYAGEHQIRLLLNGKEIASAKVFLELPETLSK